MTTHVLYVPVPGATHTILPGSGIVGTPRGERILLDYEGGRNGSESFRAYADRCLHAGGRHSTNYPTIARSFMRGDQVERIGEFDDVFGEVHLDPGADSKLAAWLGVERVDLGELATTDRRRDRRTVRDHWTPEQRQQLRQLPAREQEYYRAAGLL